MTRKRRRLVFVLAGLVLLGGAAAITLSVLSDNLVFFYSPSDLLTRHVPDGRRLRVGGLVADGSVHRATDGKTVTFEVTDKVHQVPVTYSGQLPDLFREGQGVVVEGVREADGSILAATVLAKHDERYMPPEVVDALKRAGRWQESAATTK
ncbi:MAG TPA: cytochrome c maturation protein CcmE [Stellaceae bacterium]|nr:cytochrome c maturation protein CcmE [Stellaceae bacterium]